MMLTHVATLTVIAVAAGSAAVGISWSLEGNEKARATTTPEVQTFQCVRMQDSPVAEPESAMAAYCKSANSANLRHATWATLFQDAWR